MAYYLLNSMSYKLRLYTNVGWAGFISDRHFTSSYCTIVVGNLVTWRSKKQSARSNVEAEYRAMPHGVCELLWLKMLLSNLKFPISHPMRLFCDNKATIYIAHGPI